MLKDLILFTKDYPFGEGETFLESEIKYLVKYFNRIFIISENDSSAHSRKSPDNVEVIRFTPKLSRSVKWNAIQLVWNQDFLSEFKWLSKNKKPTDIIPCLRIAADFYLKAQLIKQEVALLAEKQRIQNAILYSYWMDTATLAAYEFGKNRRGFKIISRVHGYDLYFERHPRDYLPFRKLFLTRLNAIYSISQNGINYLSNKFLVNNLKLSRLGTTNPFKIRTKISSKLKIVSCSRIIPLKRIHLIIEGLSLLNIPFFWVHIGTGEQQLEIKALAKQKLEKSQFDFPGQLDNEAVLAYYDQHQLTLFINTSETEGIPVSMMEAMSFGIPCIGTDVGGVSEIIKNNHNGYLLSPNPDPREIANIISKFDQMKERQKIKLCENARLTWEKKYDASSNYLTFAKNIFSL